MNLKALPYVLDFKDPFPKETTKVPAPLKCGRVATVAELLQVLFLGSTPIVKPQGGWNSEALGRIYIKTRETIWTGKIP